jgi:CheY-like chemotaxis protein
MNNHTHFKRRILVVDDERMVRDALFLLLSSQGHSVVTAASGPDALALFEPGKFDLVFTDYFMPVMNGDKLAAEIKTRAPAQPVIAVTAYADRLRQAPAAWFDAYLAKPFGLKQLRDLIEQYVPPQP